MIDSLRIRFAAYRRMLLGIVAAWASLATLLLIASREIDRVSEALAHMGLDDPLVLLALLAATALVAVPLRVLLERAKWVTALACRPCRVEEVNPNVFGVRRSTKALRYVREGESSPPHVHRRVDDEFAAALENDNLVIGVAGPSTGASSTVQFALQAERYRKVRLLVLAPPAHGKREPLAAMLGITLPIRLAWRPIVVLAGDIDARLRTGEITREKLDAFLRYHRRAQIVATMKSTQYDKLMADKSSVTEATRELLSSARVVTIPPQLAGEELEEAGRLYHGLTPEALTRLPQHLGVADEIIERFLRGEHSHPLGTAIAKAAVVWTQCGVTRPVPEAFLKVAARQYLPTRLRSFTPRQFLTARRWAETPVSTDAALIEPAEHGDGWMPSEFLVERMEADGTPIPAKVWSLVMGAIKLEASELIAVGVTAVQRGCPDVAVRAWDKAAVVGNDAQRQLAMGHAGALLRDRPSEAQEEEPVDALLRQVRTRSFRAGFASRRPVPVNDGAGVSASEPLFDPTVPQAVGGGLARVYRFRTLRFVLRSVLLMVCDAVGVMAGVAVALLCKALLDKQAVATAFADSPKLAFYAVVLAIPMLALRGLYAEDAPRAQLTRILRALGTAAGITAVAGVLGGGGLLTWTASWTSFLSAIPFCFATRMGYDQISRRWMRHDGLERRMLFIGRKGPVVDAATRLRASCGRPMRFVGYLSPQTSDQSPARLGSVEDLVRVLDVYRIHGVVIVDARVDADAVLRISDQSLLAEATVDMVLTPAEVQVYDACVAPGATLALQRVAPAALSIGAQTRKRCFDAIVAALSLLVLGVPMLCIAALVSVTSPGPVLVRSYRPGLGQVPFAMLKFRSTKVGSGEVTPVGRLLRRFGLDELPQLLNVIRGEMSIVGPRPLPMADFRQMRSWHRRRYLVAPGITGPWQICGRQGPIDYDETARVDLFYMKSWSVALDLLIIAKTIPAVLRRQTDLPTSHP